MPWHSRGAFRLQPRKAHRVRPPPTIAKVDHEPGDEPDHEPDPRLEREADHLGETDYAAENRDGRHPRRAEGTLEIGRRTPEDHDADTDQHECEQCAYAHKLSKKTDRQEPS